MLAQRLMWIAWPAVLLAGVIETLVFAVVDPQHLQWFCQPLAASRKAVCTLAFFAFWLLAMSPFEVNRCLLPGEGRPEGCPREITCN